MRHSTVKRAKSKDKEKILKAARNKHALTYKDRPIKLVTDLSTETWQARKEWQEICNVMNRKTMQPRILYPEKSVTQNRRRYKGFPKQRNKKTNKQNEGTHHH